MASSAAKSAVHDIVKNKAKLSAFLTEIEGGACEKNRCSFGLSKCYKTPAISKYPLFCDEDVDSTCFKAGKELLKRFNERDME